MIRALALAALVALLLLPTRATRTSGAATPAFSQATPAPLILSETPGAVPVSLLIENRGANDDRLLGGDTPVARRIEAHHSRLDDGVRVMEVTGEGLRVPAGATMILEPARDHLMLIGLTDDLVQGRSFPLTLHFARAGEMTVTVRVRRKVDAAGLPPAPPVTAGDITVSLASAPPAPALAP